MSILSYLIATILGNVVVARLNFFHLGMGQKEEEFTQSGANEGSGYPTTSYMQLLEWVKSISPEGVTWEIWDEYSVRDACNEGVKDIGLEKVVRAKAIEVGYTNQTWIDQNDWIRNGTYHDLDGNVVRQPTICPPSFPRLEFDGDVMHIVQTPPRRPAPST